MHEQLSLFDVDGTPGGSDASPPAGSAPPHDGWHNLVLVLTPPSADVPAVAAAALTAASRAGVGGRFLEAERLHVSLFLLGAHPREVPVHLLRAADRAVRRLREPAFDLSFDRAASFRRARAFVLMGSSPGRLAALRGFRETLGMALADAGIDGRRAAFEPHLTVGYRGRVIPPQAIEPIGWRARDLVLIDSHLGAHVHAVLGRWPLA